VVPVIGGVGITAVAVFFKSVFFCLAHTFLKLLNIFGVHWDAKCGAEAKQAEQK